MNGGKFYNNFNVTIRKIIMYNLKASKNTTNSFDFELLNRRQPKQHQSYKLVNVNVEYKKNISLLNKKNCTKLLRYFCISLHKATYTDLYVSLLR